MISIIATVVILGVLIFVHELGHFATAKWVDIEVPRFSIGLGPKMLGFTRGETEYVIGWLPLGGYVRMAGMDDMEALEGGEHDASSARSVGRDFESKSLAARALVISAGVIMNVLFAWLIFSVIALVWGVSPSPAPVVGDVVEAEVSPETTAMLQVPVGATITSINGRAVEDWSDVQRAIATASDSVRIEFRAAPPVTVPVPEADSLRATLPALLVPRLRQPARIAAVVEGSPAAAAGLEPGDRVVVVDGEPVEDWQDMVRAVEPRPGDTLDVVVERSGERVALRLIPRSQPVAGGGTVGRIGVSRVDLDDPIGLEAEEYPPRERLGPLAAAAYGGEQTIGFVRMILDFLGGLFTGRASARDVGGPILIYQISDRVVQIGMEAYLRFMAVFSINLAVLNLLPIPILDGGQLVFLAVEAVRGRALSLEQRMRLSQVGLVLVVAIMVWALANDVLRLFGL